MSVPTTLQEKHHTTRQAERILAEALRGRGGKITKADAIAVTGLPQQEVEPALEVLLKEYKSHLEVTEKGEILYEFDPKMERRDAVPFSERMEKLGAALWKGFMATFKVCIFLTILLYVVVYMLILLGLMASAQGDSRDSRRSRSSFNFGDGLFWWWWWDSTTRPRYGGTYTDRGRYQVGRQPKKRFIASIYDFCFGPPPPPVDPLATEKRILSYVRGHAGRLTASDLVALTGWPYDKAEQEVTRLLVDYDGDPEVTDEGTIIYVFKDLRITADSEDAAPDRREAARAALEERGDGATYFWQEPDPKERLTGNSSGANTAIVLLSAFNLFGAFALGQVGVQMGAMWAHQHGMVVDPSLLGSLQFWLETFPAAFTGIYLGVPALRAIGLFRRERRRRERNLRRGLLREIYQSSGAPVPPDDLVNRVAGSDPAQRAALRAELERMMVPYEADVDNDPRSRVPVYRFPRFARELETVKRLRAAAPRDERQVGQVIFDTDK